VTTLTDALGRFEDQAPEDILAIIDWLATGMDADACHRFDGYRGAAMGLNVARGFVILGDCPEGNAAAAAEIGAWADYALDSLYWNASGVSMAVSPDDAAVEWQATVKALTAMSRLAVPIRASLNERG
jgi:hypothetical protein